ncbi:sulfite exporter TauE/SafE family protein [Rothia sp. AR01]|uniref:Probable membrane transporter protein n=1 Tax=Rothia santali TaxID=2949643 RepID=A0A9X2KIB3_9MICC|nr:sulfite exporter TauE/SafE family protein [Rothia santali]MCP3425679.1 sulfite exporter TauE/SafE family protein [Rothia santali]
MLTDVAPWAWALLAVAALLVGVSKTVLPGVNTLSVAAFAAILPARESTGALLLLLLVGDAFAMWAYRRHAHWPTLLRLIPSVLAGLAVGALFLALADDAWVRRVIGVLLVMLVAFTLWQRRPRRERAAGATPGAGGAPGAGGTRPDVRGAGPGASAGPGAASVRTASRLSSAGYGSLGGFTTMVANAGGPVMSMYFLSARFPVHAFLGTAAWFFATMNLLKLPVSIGLGLVNAHTLVLAAVLVPAVVAGAFAGRWLAGRIRQRVFDRAIIVLTLLGSVYLLV